MGVMKRRRQALQVAGGLLAVGLVWAVQASAQESSESGGRVLHEYFDPGAVPTSGSSAASASSSSGGARPSKTSSTSGEPPGLTLNPGQGDMILGPQGPVEAETERSPYGPPSPRSGFSRLDDQTSRVDDLSYYSAFDPSVFPYKRNVVQNRVVRRQGEYGVATDPGEWERLSVASGGARADEDTFWGTFLVRADKGEIHPIPSVAPRQRFLAVESEPDVPLDFLRDGAGNHYVRVEHDGLVRINAKVATRRFYFAGRFSEGVGWGDIAGAGAPDLAEEIRPVAERVMSMVGVSRQMSPKEALEELIYYYRDFKTEALPEEAKQGDLYAAISEQQIGVCRHRSLAFVVTAQALGIPARYVTNEAHAFVEVYWPAGGWRRVDLGGAAQDINYNGDPDDSLHDGSASDPLPKPPNYREELRRMRENQEQKRQNDGEQPSAESSAEGPSGDRPDPSEMPMNRPDAGRAMSADERTGRDAGGPESAEERSADESDPQRSERVEEQTTPRPESADQTSEPADDRAAARLTLGTEARTVFRGSTVTVYGALSGEAGQPLAGRSVAVYFGRVGAETVDSMEEIGRATTDPRGRYRLKVTIPESAGIGRWSMVARFGGDEQFQPARAD
jgi:transglutaminase-like putative cysteine protease